MDREGEWIGRQVYVQIREIAKEGEGEKGLGRHKGEGTGITRINGEHHPINPMLMTQSWSMVTVYLGSDSLKTGKNRDLGSCDLFSKYSPEY